MQTKAKKAKDPRRRYTFEFTRQQWEELQRLGGSVIPCPPGARLHRIRWLMLAYMAIGKAQLLRSQCYFGTAGEPDRRWSRELRDIADVILACFRPGDGKY